MATTGLALALPAFFCLVLSLGWSARAALVLAWWLLLAASMPFRRMNPGRETPALLFGALASLSSVGILLPLAGTRLTALIAAVLAFLGWRLHSRRWETATAEEIEIGPGPRLWLGGLAAGCGLLFAQCLSRLIGHSLYAFALTMACAFLGAAAARTTRGWAAPRGLPPLAAGLGGLALLHFIRFLGINAGSAEYLQAPLRSGHDLLFLPVQAALALALWAWALAMPQEPDPNPPRESLTSRRAGQLALIGGAPLAAALIPSLGLTAAAASFNAGLIALGLAQGRFQLRTSLAASAAALLMARSLGEPFKDIWQNRLNAAFPGGRFLVHAETGSESLSVYEFSSGLRILLRNGLADPCGPANARRQAHWPLLLHRSPRRALLAGTIHPLALTSARAHGVQTDVWDPHPRLKEVRASLGGPGWEMGGEVFKSLGARPPPGAGYDVILLPVPVPWTSPEAAFSTTREALQAWKERLAPGGILALRLPAGSPSREARALKTAQDAFAHSGALDLGGCALLLASDEPLAAEAVDLLLRLKPEVLKEDPALLDEISAGPPRLKTVRPGGLQARPETRDRARNAFPLAERLFWYN